MKYFQQSVDFDYSWEEVSTSNWQKYGPWNEKTPHVIAVDTLSRSVDAATGIVGDFLLHTKHSIPSETRRLQFSSRPCTNMIAYSCAQNDSSLASNLPQNG